MTTNKLPGQRLRNVPRLALHLLRPPLDQPLGYNPHLYPRNVPSQFRCKLTPWTQFLLLKEKYTTTFSKNKQLKSWQFAVTLLDVCWNKRKLASIASGKLIRIEILRCFLRFIQKRFAVARRRSWNYVGEIGFLRVLWGFRRKNNSKIVRQHPDFPRRWLRLSEATDDFIHAGVGSAKSCDYTLEGGSHYIQKPTGKIPWNEYWLRFKTAIDVRRTQFSTILGYCLGVGDNGCHKYSEYQDIADGEVG